MHQDKLISGIVIEETDSLTLDEFCKALQVQKKMVIKMMDYHLLFPISDSEGQWRFNSASLRRARLAFSFYHDLEINMQGVALALELMEKIENLEQQMKIFKKVIENNPINHSHSGSNF